MCNIVNICEFYSDLTNAKVQLVQALLSSKQNKFSKGKGGGSNGNGDSSNGDAGDRSDTSISNPETDGESYSSE